jgi:hypothetical protein
LWDNIKGQGWPLTKDSTSILSRLGRS